MRHATRQERVLVSSLALLCFGMGACAHPHNERGGGVVEDVPRSQSVVDNVVPNEGWAQALPPIPPTSRSKPVPKAPSEPEIPIEPSAPGQGPQPPTPNPIPWASQSTPPPGT
jgi:hypothetical protein